MMLSPTLFMTAVSGVIRMGRVVREEYRDNLLKQDFTVFTNAFPIHNSQDIQWMAEDFIYRNRVFRGRCAPGGDLDALFTRESLSSGDAMDLAPDGPRRQAQVTVAVDILYEAMRSHVAGALDTRILRNASMDPRVRYVHKEWLSAEKPAGWARFGLELADVALELVGSQPEVLGFDRRADGILRAIIPCFEDLVDRKRLNEGGDEDFGERLVKTFVHSALSSLSEYPDLVTSEERWKPIVTGMILPLKQEVEQSEGLEFLAHEKLTRVLTGPMAHGALTAINANASSFLKGEFGDQDVLGQVTRAVLGDAVSVAADGFSVLDAFSEQGLLKVYDATLKTAASRPELFVKGASLEKDAARRFIQGLATSMDNGAPPPFDLRSGLGPDVMALAFDVVGEYSGARLQEKAGDKDWDTAWADIYSHMMGQLLGGLQRGLATGARPDILATLFTREQAVDLLKIMATHVASTPHMATGRNANSEVQNIASAVAQAIASDEMGLLNAGDWQMVITVMLGAAAKNPGALFSIDSEAGMAHQLGLSLIQHVLWKAEASMGEDPRQPGRILFGETLRESLVVTLRAASNNVISSIMARNPDGERLHVEELGLFIDKLNTMAASGRAEVSMSADEWLHVYKVFVAHIIEKGPGAVDQITEEHVMAALRGENAFAGLA